MANISNNTYVVVTSRGQTKKLWVLGADLQPVVNKLAKAFGKRLVAERPLKKTGEVSSVIVRNNKTLITA